MTLNTNYIKLCTCGRIPTLKRDRDAFSIVCACGNHTAPIFRRLVTENRWETDWQVFEQVIKDWNERAADAYHD